jgi:RimJ/RimL family protein N-acetyltransferase
MLCNSNVILRAAEMVDSELIRKWRFDPDNYDYFFEFIPIGREQNEIWMKNSIQKQTEINFIIEKRESNVPIGMISLIDVDHRNQKCEVGRILIGDKDARRQGFGKDSIALLIEYAFNHLNMRKIYCEVFSDNLNAVSLYRELGFGEEGLLKEHVYKNGVFKNVILMAIYK